MIKLPVIAVIASISLASSAEGGTIYRAWPIGKEREVAPGFYVKVVYERLGWRVWRWETSAGVSCVAIKPAKGKTAPVPLGVGTAFFHYQSTPFVSYYGSSKDYQWFLEGRYSGGRAEYRTIGARFWTNTERSFSLSDTPEVPIEIHITSWEYPTILAGLSEERAILDLTGKNDAMVAADACAREAKR